MNKKIGLFLTTILTSILFVGGVKASLSDDIITSRQSGINLKSYSGVKVDQKIPAEYSFGLGGRFNPNDTTVNGEVEVTDDTINCWNNSYNWSLTKSSAVSYSLAQDNIKNNYSVLYKKVGTYNNTFVDVKATVIDFDVMTAVSNACQPYIWLNKTMIESGPLGLKWYKIKYEFFKSGTTTPINVKGNTTYWDVDAKQGIIINDGNKDIYATNDTILNISTINNDKYIFDPTGNGDDATHTAYGFTETFEGQSITRTYTYGIKRQAEEWATTIGPYSGGMFHSPTPVVPIDPPAPTKTVDKEQVKIGEEFTYTITQQVPQTIQSYYYKSFSIEDTLEDVLNVDLNNISIKNENDEDVTNTIFNINVEGQKIAITPKDINNASFYGHTYTITIRTKIKDNANLNSYKQGDDYIISNHATLLAKDYNDTDINKNTNEVKLIYIPDKVVEVPNTIAGIPLYVIVTGIVLMLLSGGTFGYMKYKKLI